jgi:hypothetical protein
VRSVCFLLYSGTGIYVDKHQVRRIYASLLLADCLPLEKKGMQGIGPVGINTKLLKKPRGNRNFI